jgi:hypothetical protein
MLPELNQNIMANKRVLKPINERVYSCLFKLYEVNAEIVVITNNKIQYFDLVNFKANFELQCSHLETLFKEKSQKFLNFSALLHFGHLNFIGKPFLMIEPDIFQYYATPLNIL